MVIKEWMQIHRIGNRPFWNQKWKAGFSRQYKERMRETYSNLDIGTKKIKIQNKQQCKIHNVCHSIEDYQAYK